VKNKYESKCRRAAEGSSYKKSLLFECDGELGRLAVGALIINPLVRSLVSNIFASIITRRIL